MLVVGVGTPLPQMKEILSETKVNARASLISRRKYHTECAE
jgi:hypothetical protein